MSDSGAYSVEKLRLQMGQAADSVISASKRRCADDGRADGDAGGAVLQLPH